LIILSFLGIGFSLNLEFCLCLPKFVAAGAISTKFAVAKLRPGKSSFRIRASVLLISEISSRELASLF